MPPSGKWAVSIHGGAGVISRDTDPVPYSADLKRAVDAGVASLAGEGAPGWWEGAGLAAPSAALAAALAAVEVMEDSALFNAGRGGVLNDARFVENEASVMCGRTLRTGAVCGLRTVQNPARLAAVVLTAARFQFLGFASAEAFADRFGAAVARRPAAWFVVERRRRALERALAAGRVELDHSGGTATAGERRSGGGHCEAGQNGSAATAAADAADAPEGGTVGAAVCDGAGNVAVVTSTGGQTGKMAGRIGDTPVIGAGSYADNRACALSGTGDGEHFLRLSAASRVCCAMQYGGLSCRDAVAAVVRGPDFPPGAGGFVAVTPAGEVVADFNSTGMFRAARNWQGVDTVRIWED